MIQNFEKETHDLTKEELRYVQSLRDFLMRYVGADNAVKNRQILIYFKNTFQINLGTEARVRKLINHIRRNEIFNLAASSKGYYIENDVNKLQQYVKGLYDRANAIKAVADVSTKYIQQQREIKAQDSQKSLF